jgi:uncharacterized protein
MKQVFETDFEIQAEEVELAPLDQNRPWTSGLKYIAAGIFFGIILIKAEVVSWFRIQEMFRFQSFHMYGVIGSAIVTGIISVWLIKKFRLTTFGGDPIRFHKKKFHKGNIFGGLLFGFGWALTGACPGPLFALIGSGALVFLIPLLSAIAGTWTYGAMQHRMPH